MIQISQQKQSYWLNNQSQKRQGFLKNKHV